MNLYVGVITPQSYLDKSGIFGLFDRQFRIPSRIISSENHLSLCKAPQIFTLPSPCQFFPFLLENGS